MVFEVKVINSLKVYFLLIFNTKTSSKKIPKESKTC